MSKFAGEKPPRHWPPVASDTDCTGKYGGELREICRRSRRCPTSRLRGWRKAKEGLHKTCRSTSRGQALLGRCDRMITETKSRNRDRVESTLTGSCADLDGYGGPIDVLLAGRATRGRL